jgi:uncharacterized membrane protein
MATMPGPDNTLGPMPALDAEPEATSRKPRRRWWPRRYAFGGLVIALVFVWLSMTPTLLPRGPLFQGLVSGASAAVGYGIGVLGSSIVRYAFGREPSRRFTALAWRALPIVALIGTVLMSVWFLRWQDQLRVLMGVAPLPTSGYLVIGALTVVLFVLFIQAARLWMGAVRWVTRQVNRVAPPRVSALVAAIVVVALTIGVLNGVVVSATMSALNSTFEELNQETKPGAVAPASPLRSGGPGSLVSWASLGRQGRAFAAGGPTVEALSQFSGRPAVYPVRAYTGLASAKSIQAEADLAVRELERAGGFQRAVVGVVVTTGSGWINADSAAAVEYLYNGNTAMVSMQYSYLPSWVSFLVDRDRAKQAGQALFDAVYAKWKTLAEVNRPKLVVVGESLGSFGGEAAFSGVQDIQARTDGILFVGPPSSNVLWSTLVSRRDPGTPQWLPIYQHGQTVRFVARASDLDRPGPSWPAPRMVYLQHASDPITWWTPSLLFKKPDWLKEPRGYDVLPSTGWFPIVTFLQVSADMAVSTDVPDGHGHRFAADIANAWAAILQPQGWAPADTERLRATLTQPDLNP